jgi:hypothetical protein
MRLRRRNRDARARDTRDRLDELTERTRMEAHAISRRQRREARRRMRAQAEGFEDLGVRMRGTAYETRRRLRPVFAPVRALAGWVAPYITRTLLFVIKLVAALIALLAELGTVTVRWLIASGTALASGTWELARRHVTPLGTVAFVGIAAAVGLGVSQFFDYHGVAVDAPNYAGEVGVVAPAPVTGTATAGSAHLWILLPLAAAAAVLVVATYLGRTRLAGAVALCGLLGVAVTLAIDLPQGLDAGRPGLAFSGSEAELLQGFWAELACSAILMLCGGLLALYSRDVAAPRRGRRASLGRQDAARAEVGEIPPGLQAES